VFLREILFFLRPVSAIRGTTPRSTGVLVEKPWFFGHGVNSELTRRARQQFSNVLLFSKSNKNFSVNPMNPQEAVAPLATPLRDHPGTPQDKLPGILYWPLFTKPPQKAAWTTAEHTEVLSYMPRSEVRDTTDVYVQLDYSWDAYQPVIASLTQCTAYFSQAPDISTLPATSVVNEIEMIKLAMAREALYGNTLSALGHRPEFGPVPTWWQMLPYWTMRDYYAWARQHPELSVPSKSDIDGARAFAGLPPETSDSSFEDYTAPVPNSDAVKR
jgi:hypothetical protein